MSLVTEIRTVGISTSQKGFAYNKSTPEKSQTITDKTHLVTTTTQSSATMIRTNSLNNSTSSKLLRWCQFVTQEYPNVDITNLNESFRNGLAMCAILHHFHPDLYDYASLNEGNPSFNHKLHTEQFELVGGTSYVEPDDFSLKRLEEKSLFTHLRTMYETLNDRAPHVGYFDKKTYAPFGSETTTVVAEDDVGDMSDVENEDVDNKRDDNNGGDNNDHTVTQQQIQQQQQNVVEEDEKTRRRREHLERFERERLAREQAEQLLATITSTEATEPTVATDSIMTDDDDENDTTTTSINNDDKMDTSIAVVTENHDDNEILRMKNAEIEAQEQKLLFLRQEHEQQLQSLQFQFQQFQEQSAQRQQELEQNQRAQQELLQKELEIQRQDQEKLRVELQEQVRSLVEHHQFELQDKQDKLQLSLQQQKEEHGSELQKLQQQLHQQKEREQELVRQLQQKEQQWKEQTEKLQQQLQEKSSTNNSFFSQLPTAVQIGIVAVPALLIMVYCFF